MKRDLETKLEEAKQMTELQGNNGNWNYDPYMQGVYNGMEYVLAIFEEREPKFRSAPDMWLADKINTGRDFSEPVETSQS